MTAGPVSLWLDDLRRGWQDRDPRVLANLFTEDVAYALTPFQAPLVGRDAVLAHWVEELAGVLAVDVVLAPPVVDGDRVAVEWRSEVKGVGGHTTEAGVLIVEFEDGLCSRLAEYWMVDDGAADLPETSAHSTG